MPDIIIFRDACKGIEDCGICAYICPKDLFRSSGELNTAGYIPPRLNNEDDCIACKNCMIYCPDFAIVVEGTEREPQLDEVVDEY